VVDPPSASRGTIRPDLASCRHVRFKATTLALYGSGRFNYIALFGGQGAQGRSGAASDEAGMIMRVIRQFPGASSWLK
jgi:hypothetical protein